MNLRGAGYALAALESPFLTNPMSQLKKNTPKTQSTSCSFEEGTTDIQRFNDFEATHSLESFFSERMAANFV